VAKHVINDGYDWLFNGIIHEPFLWGDLLILMTGISAITVDISSQGFLGPPGSLVQPAVHSAVLPHRGAPPRWSLPVLAMFFFFCGGNLEMTIHKICLYSSD